MSETTDDRVRNLVREFCANVDSGCANCSGEAVDALAKIFPEWADVAQAEYTRCWEQE